MDTVLLETLSKDKWLRIGLKRRAGILVPLFSIYSKKSQGIGDFQDLKLLIDWCDKCGISIVQLLPMNELGGLLCPYDSLSSFAIEPIYLSLEKLLTESKKFNFKKGIEDIRREFPAGREHIDYGVRNRKIRFLWDSFQEDFSGIPDSLNDFIEENSYWIYDFAVYKVLKEFHSGLPWYEWKDEFKNRDAVALESFYKNNEKAITFQMWLQWQLYRQFKDAKAYAASKNVLLKGDLPILVSRDSADVWAHSEFFKLEFASGAPPDMYCAKGQRWGMPTYEWGQIAADDYRYLKEKLKFAQNFYDILRIDHVVGLFRIWSIPYNDTLENAGLNGVFDPAEEKQWEEHGRNLLMVMHNNTSMLLCAEDLGVIPKACPGVLQDIGIPGNDVQRWIKDWKIKHDFLDPQDYRFLAVAMLSTHDTTNWAAWWENEAGTIDEALFMRRCAKEEIDYPAIKDKLFDSLLSRHGRLRWKEEVSSPEILLDILAKKKEKVADLVGMYEDTYREKEKLWKKLALAGPLREKADKVIVSAVLNFTLRSKAIFCIELIVDWLYLAGIFKGDPYQYRINTPGTISEKNWSRVMPISVDDLLKNSVTAEIKGLVNLADRA